MAQSEKYTEKEIIEQILKGEKGLYEIIVRRYNPILYKIGRSYNFNHENTQDLMQEAFIDAYKNLSQFEERSSFKTWIIRIMMNNCYRKINKLSFKNEVMQDIDGKSEPLFSNTKNETTEIIHNHEMKSMVENALGKIPFDYRVVFSLREINELSVVETAELLNISESNVKVRLSRAKTMLRDDIEKNYSTGDLFSFNLIYCDGIVEYVMSKIKDF